MYTQRKKKERDNRMFSKSLTFDNNKNMAVKIKILWRTLDEQGNINEYTIKNNENIFF